MTLAPEPRPGCDRNLAIWTDLDGTRRQMCCCEDCSRARDEAFELVQKWIARGDIVGAEVISVIRSHSARCTCGDQPEAVQRKEAE